MLAVKVAVEEVAKVEDVPQRNETVCPAVPSGSMLALRVALVVAIAVAGFVVADGVKVGLVTVGVIVVVPQVPEPET